MTLTGTCVEEDSPAAVVMELGVAVDDDDDEAAAAWACEIACLMNRPAAALSTTREPRYNDCQETGGLKKGQC